MKEEEEKEATKREKKNKKRNINKCQKKERQLGGV
jgi:hypothetical protein